MKQPSFGKLLLIGGSLSYMLLLYVVAMEASYQNTLGSLFLSEFVDRGHTSQPALIHSPRRVAVKGYAVKMAVEPSEATSTGSLQQLNPPKPRGLNNAVQNNEDKTMTVPGQKKSLESLTKNQIKKPATTSDSAQVKDLLNRIKRLELRVVKLEQQLKQLNQ